MRSRTLALALLLAAASLSAQSFTDVTAAAGLAGAYAPHPNDNTFSIMSGGVAVADYDGDGWEDVFWPGGSAQWTRLFHNEGDGSFVDVAQPAGVALKAPVSGPLFFDAEGDGDLDLLCTTSGNQLLADAAANGGPAGLSSSAGPTAQDPDPGFGLVDYRNFYFENQGDGTFVEKAKQAGLLRSGRWGSAFGNVNADGRCDLVTLTWNPPTDRTHVLLARPDGGFRDATPPAIANDPVWGFTPRIADYDLDGDNDLLLANDISTNRLWRNMGGTFVDWTLVAGVSSVENGMGSALGDVDRDGDLDWFVTSIYAEDPLGLPFFGFTGNRLWLNDGDGTFTDATTSGGVRDGGWGWAAQFADLDNDGDLDLPQANGYYQIPPEAVMLEQFTHDKLRLFRNDGAGHFTDVAVQAGIDDPDQGRGLVVFDHDHDGALDILVANHDTGLTLYRGSPAAAPGHWLWVELTGDAPNPFGVGARVTLSAAGQADQVQLLECGNNFLSQAPLGLWFGLGPATSATLNVRWPDGQLSTHPVAADQRVTLVQP